MLKIDVEKLTVIAQLIAALADAGQATVARIRAVHTLFALSGEELNKVLDEGIAKALAVRAKAQAEIDRVSVSASAPSVG